jgi:hypothetical protein
MLIAGGGAEWRLALGGIAIVVDLLVQSYGMCLTNTRNGHLTNMRGLIGA